MKTSSSSCEVERQEPTVPRARKSVDFEVFERQAVICKAFAHPKRLQLLDLIGKGERSVSELQATLEVSKANMSQHLSVLRAAGVVITRRDGKLVYCSLAIPEVRDACHLIREVLRSQVRKQHNLTI